MEKWKGYLIGSSSINEALQLQGRFHHLAFPNLVWVCFLYGYRTLTTPVELIKCLKSIKENAFATSPYPVIITLEDHLTSMLQSKVAQVSSCESLVIPLPFLAHTLVIKSVFSDGHRNIWRYALLPWSWIEGISLTWRLEVSHNYINQTTERVPWS